MQSIADPAGILQHPQFQAAVEALAQKAHAALPLANGRLEKAVDIVLRGGVTLHPDGYAVVQSQSRPHTSYSVNGTCGCPDMAEAPGQWCKHRIAAALLKRSHEALARLPPPVTDLLPIEEPPAPDIAPRFITYLHGRPFVMYAGLLTKAHEARLMRLDTLFNFGVEIGWCTINPLQQVRKPRPRPGALPQC